MRYSVLLPTRNGGPFLRNCIRSILSQDYDDFELVISDNANTDETPEIIAELRDHPKVKAIRLDQPVPVTDNWTAAYTASTGDYTLMMGDDDYLLPDYFRTMDAILERHSFPDCVLYNGYSYVAPGSIEDAPGSFYTPQYFTLGPDMQREAELSSEQKRGIVRDMFRWKVRIPLNMQTTLVGRRAADRIEGGFYQPPFPDHYALNSLLLMDARWVVSPEQLVIVGVSPKSFGHYAYSGKEASGLSYLGIEPTFPGELPGSPLLNGMHVWLDRLKAGFPNETRAMEIDRARYVQRQVYQWLLETGLGRMSTTGLFQRLRLLSPRDWLGLGRGFVDRQNWGRLYSVLARGFGAAQVRWNSLRPTDAKDIADFASRLRPPRNPIDLVPETPCH